MNGSFQLIAVKDEQLPSFIRYLHGIMGDVEKDPFGKGRVGYSHEKSLLLAQEATRGYSFRCP